METNLVSSSDISTAQFSPSATTCYEVHAFDKQFPFLENEQVKFEILQRDPSINNLFLIRVEIQNGDGLNAYARAIHNYRTRPLTKRPIPTA
jgi:hypothetical protein